MSSNMVIDIDRLRYFNIAIDIEHIKDSFILKNNSFNNIFGSLVSSSYAPWMPVAELTAGLNSIFGGFSVFLVTTIQPATSYSWA